jgi:putative phosphotransacetylase
MSIPVGVSARHIHLSQADLEALFGYGAVLHPAKSLSQPGQFAAEEKLDLQGPRGMIPGVRVLGPVRPQTQVELSKTDAMKLGVDAPVRESGHIDNTPGLTLIGTKGQVELRKGVIVAMRHVHFSPSDARRLGVADKEEISVRADQGDRSLIFQHEVARVSPSFRLDFHIDTDEANAAGLHTGDEVDLVEVEDFHGNEIIRQISGGRERDSSHFVGVQST